MRTRRASSCLLMSVGVISLLAPRARAETSAPETAAPVASQPEPPDDAFTPVITGEVPVASALDTLPEIKLDEAIAAVLKNSPDLEAARYKLAQAEEGVTQVWATLLPRVSVSGTYTRFNKAMKFMMPDFASITVDPATCNGAPFCFTRMSEAVMQPADAYGFQASVTVPLFIAPAYFAASQLKHLSEAAKLGTDHGRQMIVAATANLYWAALGAQSVRDVTASAELQGKKHLRAAGQWRQAGTGTDIVVTQAELALVKAQQDRIQAEEQYRILLKNLAIMMGRSPARPAKIEVADAPLPTEEEAVKQALRNRRDYLATVETLEAAKRQHRATLAAYLPSVVATGTYQGQNVKNFNGDRTSWNAMLIARWDLFDGFGRESRMAQASAAVSEQEASLRGKQQQITQEVNNALMGVTKAKAQLAVLAKQVELAKRNAEALDVAYNNGASNSLEYDDAQNAYTQAQLGLASARLQVAMARTSLQQALGCIEGCDQNDGTKTTTGKVALAGGH